VRVQTVETLLLFEKELGEDFINDKSILRLLMDRLSDRVYGVREGTLNTLKKMCQKLGPAWCEKQALPIICNFQTNQNYLYRMNYCMGLYLLAGFITTSSIGKVGNPLLAMAREDKVANIRYNSLKALYEIKKNLKDKSFDEKAKKCFVDMKSDKDRDVSDIATKFSNL